jgi:hypothetical protein
MQLTNRIREKTICPECGREVCLYSYDGVKKYCLHSPLGSSKACLGSFQEVERERRANSCSRTPNAFLSI